MPQAQPLGVTRATAFKYAVPGLYDPKLEDDDRYHADLRCRRIPHTVARYRVGNSYRLYERGYKACSHCWQADGYRP